MIVTVGGNKYSARSNATYAANEILQNIFAKYYWRNAPLGFYAEDGSIALIDSEEIEGDGFRKVPRELTREESLKMSARVYNNPDYVDEVLDFHLIPIGNAPILSYFLATGYEPTEEEQEEIASARDFFLKSGKDSKAKKTESLTTVDQTSPQEKEAMTPQNT